MPRMTRRKGLRVLVLAGGPNRERPVSLISGSQVAAALREAGHDVTLADANPGDLSAIDHFIRERGDVIFPIFHGGWGEGGGVQRELDARGARYVGCRAAAAALCMDKVRSKELAQSIGVATPAFERVARGDQPTLAPPVVVKPITEGSSIHLAICKSQQELDEAWAALSPHYDAMLVERYLPGAELTVGILGTGDAARALPVIHIIPATPYYDYQAKYERDDTQYRFDFDADISQAVQTAALKLYRAAGCRHLARVDFIVDRDSGGASGGFIEINTLPGFTTHSLLPMAARESGLPMPKLVDALVRMAMDD